jgi:hypothetical protein
MNDLLFKVNIKNSSMLTTSTKLESKAKQFIKKLFISVVHPHSHDISPSMRQKHCQQLLDK